MYGFIYITTCLVNGKRYIGKCSYKRKCWPNYLGSGKWLIKAIKKYGTKNFTRQIILECKTSEELSKRELELIDQYNAANSRDWYNIYSSSATNKGFQGRKHTPERNAQVAAKLLGRKRPPHVGEAVRKAKKGKKRNPSSVAKQREFYKELGHPKAKIITINGVTYESMAKACSSLNISYYKLYKLLKSS